MILNFGERKEISKSYGFLWAQKAENKFEGDTLYGKSEEEEFKFFLSGFNIQPLDLKGKRVLDAGCGCGRLTRMLGSYSDEVFGIDISSSINYVYGYCKTQENVHIIQADLLKLPFREDYFDYVWSNAAICYTKKSEEAFKHLSSLVKPSGKLFVCVLSATNLSFMEKVRGVFWFSHKIPIKLLFYLSYLFAIPWSLAKYIFNKPHSIRVNAFNLFDTLAQPYYTRHSEEEVKSWFMQEGYSLIKSFDKGGAVASGIKKHKRS